MKRIDLTGQKFGRLTVISYSHTNRKPLWNCSCDCGNTAIVRGADLKHGKTKSCGCIAKEVIQALHTLHGKCKTRLYRIWGGMKTRCYNQNSSYYQYYGGRGITVCEEWRNSFQAFYDWAMANGYRDDLSIDRIDNDGNYCPENCRWATPAEQANNQRPKGKKKKGIFLEFWGEIKTISQWADSVGISYDTLHGRLERGWSVEKALTTPVTKRKD